MKILIIKLGATGDVVRTTTLLNVLEGEIDWVTTDRNLVFLNKIHPTCRGIPWSRRNMIRGNTYDLVINLEDATETAELLNRIDFREFYGAYLPNSSKITYTDSSKKWFDLSIISRFGKEKADELKHQNRKTYQELIFEGLGYRFDGQKYLLPKSKNTNLTGDIAIAPKSGTVWPMKNWAYFDP